jgi:hypothetical protein
MNRQIPFLLFLFFFCFGLPSQTLDDVLARNHLSRGGRDKLLAVKSLKISGRMTLPELGIEMPLVLWQKDPDKLRIESTFQNQVIVQASDGGNTWRILPFLQTGEPQDMPADLALMFRECADFPDPLVFYKARGDRLELLGREEIGGTPVYKLRLTRRGVDRPILYFLDAESGMEMKNSSPVMNGGKERTVESWPRDFRPVDGVMMPFAVETRGDGKLLMQMTFDSVEINPVIDDSLFRKPQPKQDIKAAGGK